MLLPPPLIFLAALVVGPAAATSRPDPLAARRRGPTGSAACWWGSPSRSRCRAFSRCWRRETAIDPYKATTAIVQAGPYRFSRNPLYVALTLLSVGIAAWSNTLWILLLLVPAVVVLRIGVIRREEAYLDRKFGDEYRAYQARVRRWI